MKKKMTTALILAPLLLIGLSATVAAATYRHASGVGFSYPDAWQLKETAEFLLLIPPNTRTAPDGAPDEFVLVGSDAIEPNLRVDDPRITEFFSNSMQEIDSAARQIGALDAKPDQGALQFKSPTREYLIRYRLQHGLGLYMAHAWSAGKPPNPAFSSVFDTFGGELAQDPALLGRWSGSTSEGSDISYSADGGSSYVSANALRVIQFEADNTVSFGASASVQSQSPSYSIGTSSSSADSNTSWGTYSASGGSLVMRWLDGEEENCEYSTFSTADGPALKLICNGERAFYRRTQ